ncbi:MAG: hypothetical protein CMC13_09930 [Flavobacteriaceae bacterium]|nr:hypothetical protein [Flavobacteriaceae bacterium]
MTQSSIQISAILSSIYNYPKVLIELEKKLKHFQVHSSFVEFTIPEITPYTLNVHFHKFSRSKKYRNIWYCRYYIYTQPGCLSFINKDLDYSHFDETVYNRICEIAHMESVMIKINS